MKPSWIETISEKIGLIPKISHRMKGSASKVTPSGPLAHYPDPEDWHDFAMLDPKAYPEEVERRYSIIPTTCFNCESACGLLAYVDKEKGTIRRFEGNPEHPGSRGRNCAKGPATINQVDDPERILYPLKRVGPRGAGQLARASWDEALDTIADQLKRIAREHGPQAVCMYTGRGSFERSLEEPGPESSRLCRHCRRDNCHAGTSTSVL